MRKIGVPILLVLCVLAASLVGAGPKQRQVRLADGTAVPSGSHTKEQTARVLSAPTSVSAPAIAAGFPLTVNVTGAVDVRNFPATQNVAGTVAVNNLPLDAAGNVRVAGAMALFAPQGHVSGITSASLPVETGILALSRACNAEFPESRICLAEAVLSSIPPPPTWTGFAAVARNFDEVDLGSGTPCFSSDGTFYFDCKFIVSEVRVACCGS
jgi:hypothetical protein